MHGQHATESLTRVRLRREMTQEWREEASHALDLAAFICTHQDSVKRTLSGWCEMSTGAFSVSGLSPNVE
jgi:hypothetical protein